VHGVEARWIAVERCGHRERHADEEVKQQPGYGGNDGKTAPSNSRVFRDDAPPSQTGGHSRRKREKREQENGGMAIAALLGKSDDSGADQPGVEPEENRLRQSRKPARHQAAGVGAVAEARSACDQIRPAP
jgi:hypothetical protein